MRRKPRRKGERFIEFRMGRIVVVRLIIFSFIVVLFFFPWLNTVIAGLKEEKTPSGEAPSAQFRSEFRRVLEKSRELGKTK